VKPFATTAPCWAASCRCAAGLLVLQERQDRLQERRPRLHAGGAARPDPARPETRYAVPGGTVSRPAPYQAGQASAARRPPVWRSTRSPTCAS
jgi:hypothetical protein